MSKDLKNTTPRIGIVYRFGDSRPLGVGQLTITDRTIVLELPTGLDITVGFDEPEPFTVSTDILDSTGRLVFADHSMRIGLGECRLAGQSSNLIGELTGRVRVAARFAVELDNLSQDLFNINGMRSEIDGLAAWTALSSVEKQTHYDDQGLISGLTTTARSQTKVDIAPSSGLSFNPHFSFEESRNHGTHTITEKVLVQTFLPTAADWEPHVMVHQSVQDLLTIAYWRRCQLQIASVTNKDHPLTDPLDGTPLSDRWRSSTSTWSGRGQIHHGSSLNERDTPLFSFDDIGVEGVRRWVDEANDWARVVNPLSSSRFQRGSTTEVLLLQVGVAIEALGYRIATRNGTLNTRGQLSFPQYMKTIHDSLDCSIDSVIRGDDNNGVAPFGSFEDWAAAFNSLYKGAKHADQPSPDSLHTWVIATSGALLVRLWLAREFGASRETVEFTAQCSR